MHVKIVTIIGARPQFIKAAAVCRAFLAAPGVTETLVHTGQHYDTKMSDIFFSDLGIPTPAYSLGIGGLSHGAMTGRMLEKLEGVLETEQPDAVLLYGDTNSTLAGALAAAKLHIPVAHVEAGLRSFNNRMPEEINRVLSDRLSRFLFCPSDVAAQNLAVEGITKGVHVVGDVMYDATLLFKPLAARTVALDQFGVAPGAYALATVHREENTDDRARLEAIFKALGTISADVPVVLPLHPRTGRRLSEAGLTSLLEPLKVVEPLSYLEMHRLLQDATAVLTDSGGVQKEAFFHGVPCITLRDETEWVETVELGWNTLCGADEHEVLRAWRGRGSSGGRAEEVARPYGDGDASQRIVQMLLTGLQESQGDGGRSC